MTPYDLNRLSQDLQNWIAARFLEPILNIEGGWEYWIQIDFPCWLDTTYKTQFDIRREVTGVANGRLDWLINSQGAGPATAVELKAQTHKYLTATFLADIQTDIAKLQTVGGGATKLMIAAACDDAAANALTGQHFINLFYLPNKEGAFFLKQI